MRSEQEILRRAGILCLVGIALISLACLTPDAKGDGAGFFLKTALSHSWGDLFDLKCVWCSLKVILFSLGLLLVIESLGTILAVSNRKTFALLVYLTHVVPCCGVLLGVYCLVKALF